MDKIRINFRVCKQLVKFKSRSKERIISQIWGQCVHYINPDLKVVYYRKVNMFLNQNRRKIPGQGRMNHARKVLGLPEHIMPICVIPLGYPPGVEKPKDKYDLNNTHWEKWWRFERGLPGGQNKGLNVLFQLPHNQRFWKWLPGMETT